MARLPSVEKGTQFAEALWNDTSGIILPTWRWCSSSSLR